MISLFQELLYILSWLILVFLFKNSFRIFFRGYLPAEYSRPLSYVLPLFLFGYSSWFLVLVRIPYAYLWIMVILAGVYCLYHRTSLGEVIREDYLWDAGFLLFFGMFLTGYSLYADIFSIFDIERERGVMMMASILRNPVVPPLDPSFCGGFLDIYYYLIFWVFAGIGYVTGTPVSCINGLAGAVLFGSSAILLYALGKIIIPKLSLLPLLILIIPRPSFFYFLFTVPGLHSLLSLSEKSAFGIIDGCDYDTQLTGTLYQNIHPMIGALALRLAVLFLILIILTQWDGLVRKTQQILLGLLSVSSALLFITYAWDTVIFAPFVMVLFFYLVYRELRRDVPSGGDSRHIDPKSSIPAIFSLAYPVLPGILLAGIWFGTMQNAGVTGLVLNFQTRLCVTDMLLVNGWLIVILFVHCFREMRERPLYLLAGIIPVYLGYASLSLLLVPFVYILIKKEKFWYDYLAVWAIAGLIFSELFTIVTVFYGPDRFNTTLKINWSLWPVIWISMFGICNSWLAMYGKLQKKVTYAIGVFLVLAFVVVLIISPALSYGDATRISIDGAARAEATNPDLPRIITLLSNDPDTRCFAEKTYLDSLSEISILSGIPNYVQAPMVEEVWGRNRNEVDKREDMVQQIYTNRSFSIREAAPQISYIILDGSAGESYGTLSMNTTGLQEVYANNSIRVFKVPGLSPDNQMVL